MAQNNNDGLSLDESNSSTRGLIIDEDYCDLKPERHSSTEESKTSDGDISFSDFTPEHHSSIDEQKTTSISGQRPAVHFDIPLSHSEIDEIMTDTELLLDLFLQKAVKQEKLFTSMVYRVYNMDSDINVYKTLVDQLNRFVGNYSSTFDEYFKNLSQALPLYGDFNVALQQTTEEALADLPRDAAEEISRKIRDSCYVGGLALKNQSSIVRDINYWIAERLSTIQGFEVKQPLRLKVIENAIMQLRKLVQTVIQLKTQLHYLMIDETHQPAADYSKLAKL